MFANKQEPGKGATKRGMTEMLSGQQDNGHKSGCTVQGLSAK